MRLGQKHPASATCVAVMIVMTTLAAPAGAGPVTAVQVPEVPGNELDSAVLKIREGHSDQALALIRELATKHPEWPPAAFILSRLLFAANQPVPARRALDQAAGDAPGHPAAFIALAGLALADGRVSDAQLNLEHARVLTDAGKWNAEQTLGFRRDILSGLASVAEARDDGKTAERHLREWLELEPRNAQARYRLGGVQFRLGKPDEAFASLQQAVKESTSLEPAAVAMARLYSQKGDVKKAEEWFDYAIKLEPKNARTHLARAAWLLDLGRVKIASSGVDEALKLDPSSKDAQRLRGLVAWHLRDLSSAEAILQPLLRDTPNDRVAADLLAVVLVEQEDPVKRARGLQLAENTAKKNPQSHEAMAIFGWAHYRAGHLDQADRLLRAAVQGVRTTPDVAYYLARVLADQGRADDAMDLLKSATKLPGAFAHRDDANALLESLKKS